MEEIGNIIFSFHQKKLLAGYLFAELQTIPSEVLLLVILLSCDPIVVVIWGSLVTDLMYKLCSSAIQSAFPSLLLLCLRIAAVLVAPKVIFFVFQNCCSIYLDMLLMARLYSLVFLQELPPVRMWSVGKLGRTIIKTPLEADFCFHLNAISVGWSSVIAR